MIKLSFPIIEGEKRSDYELDLKKTNIFLYIESVLQKSDLSKDRLDWIEKILLKKLDSKYSIIRKI